MTLLWAWVRSWLIKPVLKSPCIHDWECTGDVMTSGTPEFTCRKCGKVCPAGTPI